MLNGKTILVTGGTGSFGHHIVKRLVPLKPKEIRILSRDEKKQYDMKHEFSAQSNLKFIVGDVRDATRVREAVTGCNIIYHAAALKQVPSCEDCPSEAIKTNILGAKNLIDAAVQEGVEKFVAISTDKAVKPVNVMGMTKALQEKLVVRANYSEMNVKKTKFSCVRYGNVMGSRGSVIPFFRKKLAAGEVLPITHEDMTRFMLTLGDAIDLVFFATEHMQGGEIFVKKAPSAKITELAGTLSKEAGKKLQIKIIGTFPGEKIHEILISEEEMGRAEDKGDYFIVHHKKTNENINGPYSEYSSKEEVTTEDVIEKLLKKSDEEKEGPQKGIFFK